MKRFVLGLVCGVMLAIGTAAYASDTVQAVLFPAKFVINGQVRSLDGEYTALNVDGHAYVPVRFIAEQMGATVGFLASDTNTIYINYPDYTYIKGNIKIGATKQDAIRLLGDRYKEVEIGGPVAGPDVVKAWRYDTGVRDGYRVQAVRQKIETWIDPEGLRDGLIRLQLLLLWNEEGLERYYLAYADQDGTIRYEVDDDGLKLVQDKLLAAREELELSQQIKLIYAGEQKNELYIIYKAREHLERRWTDQEADRLRRALYEEAGLNPLIPFPLKLEQFYLRPQADVAGVITKLDENEHRVLIVDETRKNGNSDQPYAMWVGLSEEAAIVEAGTTEPLAFHDLHVGQKARAWYDIGIVELSYPGQTKALKIEIER
ncbi:DUF3221 domain-containing protein [Paenibacillus ginsengarvi]|uniref:DUF3221 domain-containing protein n=1 Tax=Paenibacillus ginsengarvi TaxID=400777 RepID=A0A3B0B015_9BACL|nr:stalk domain-containing protein [Paenibacillus ginsengarvi]RKN66113.1 DUF3221 domain-containing protein [Paenibacillus ginsengarvi]